MIEVLGAAGAVGRATVRTLEVIDVTQVGALHVRVLATPAATWSETADGLTVAAAVRTADVAETAVTVPAAGWWGGLGTLLADVALRGCDDAKAVHVAYGLPGARRAWRRASSTLRAASVGVATDPVRALVDGSIVDEVAGEARRLAWFPKPVGPAHAAAVAGLETLVPLDAPTVRTWVAVGSMGAEALQAIGRSRPERGLGRMLARRAESGGGAPGDTADLRWACVVEVLDGDGQVVRAWANGVDPVHATGAMLAIAARDLAVAGTIPAGSSLLALGPAEARLDELADLSVLRWSVARPEPSRR